MARRLLTLLLASSAAGCSTGGTEAVPLASAESFIGAWRSVTAPIEFVRLTVDSKSSEQGALGARLTFSGVAWDGSGRVFGDSLLVQMSMNGGSETQGTLVARMDRGETLHVVLRSSSADPLTVRFVRDQ